MPYLLNSLSQYSAHFALAVVVNPWSCLSEDGKATTTVLYFDSQPMGPMLATSQIMAGLIIELDEIRARVLVNKSVDTGYVEEVSQRIKFVKVKGSLLFNASAWSEGLNTGFTGS